MHHHCESNSKSYHLNGNNQLLRGALIFCALIGIISVVSGFATEPVRTWGALLFNFYFFFAITVCAMAFAAMQDIVGAKWGRPIKRLHESYSGFLIFVSIFFIVFLICIRTGVLHADRVYRWVQDPHLLDHFHGKKSWLKPDFMVWRDIVAVLVMLALACWQVCTVLKRDKLALEAAKEGVDSSELAHKTADRLRYWSAPICVVYAIGLSLLAFDLLMSLAPTWFSTLWGGWIFAMGMQTFFATLLLVMFALRSTAVGHVYSTQQYHDVGKLMHGFTIFFAYLTYAHVLTYWYGNMPEETEYFIHRLHQPWLSIVLIAPFFNFVIPLFALIPKAAKYTPVYTPIICLMILISQWFVMMLVVMPEVVKVDKVYLPFLEIGILFGVAGLFVSSLLCFWKKHSMVSIADPIWPEKAH